MTPLFSRLYLIPIPEAQKSASGLIIPSTDYVKGKVLFTGPNCTVSPNTEVLYEKGTGAKYNHNGNDGLFFNDKDIIAIL